jgi:hypothetical protein
MITLLSTLVEIQSGRAFMEHEGRVFTLPLTKEELAELAGSVGEKFVVTVAAAAERYAEVGL